MGAVDDAVQVWRAGYEGNYNKGPSTTVNSKWWGEFVDVMDVLAAEAEKGCMDCEDSDPRPMVQVPCPNCRGMVALRLNIGRVSSLPDGLAVEYLAGSVSHQCFDRSNPNGPHLYTETPHA